MKNRKSLLIGGAMATLLVAVLVGVGARSVYAQTSTPTTPATPLLGRGPGGHGGGFSLTGIQIAAQKLGMTTDELITALRGGKTLEQVAQEKGINIADIQTAIQEANKTELRSRIDMIAEIPWLVAANTVLPPALATFVGERPATPANVFGDFFNRVLAEIEG